MPTWLPVLLQMRKSALVGWAVSATAAMTSAPPASARGSQAVQRVASNACSRGPVFHPARTQLARRSEKPISRELLRTVNEDRPEVVHVGQRRTRRHQIAKFLKEFRRIVGV